MSLYPKNFDNMEFHVCVKKEVEFLPEKDD